ncbi:cilia- and flagella-associated protein 206 isoform X2 [Latimeria chalumnae]|uniref:cilia- and flagella-associated protein 206 isoform X2 n=1 Tax=Latimeria chalumnae TaxID=7897 RepID=UPI00313E0D22
MSQAQAESVIKNIIREIAQECTNKGETVSETLVAFIVKAVVLDPRNEFNVDRTLTKTDVQNLIKLCVDRLLDKNSVSLETIKMQVYFDMNYTSRVEFLNEHQRVLESRLALISREITDSRARARDELQSLYRKIVSYVLLHSGLGSPTDINVVREATAALQSVFPQTELGTFLSLNKKNKEHQLKELTMIVTGIRLFNRDCGKGGEGIDNLPAVLNEAIPATTKQIDTELHISLHLSFCYTATLEKKAWDTQSENLSNQLKEALYSVRQHVVFLRIILSDLITCAKQVELMENQLGARMEQLKMIVQAKTAVPTAQVYPHFIAVSNLWTGFQNELVLLSVLSNIAVNLQPLMEIHKKLFPLDMLQHLLEDIIVKTDEERIQETKENRVNSSDFRNQEWLFPETTANFDKLLLQNRGFCSYTFAKNGVLLPGNPAIGILKYKENYYSFSSKEAAYAFANNPDKYITMTMEKAMQHAELIQLLELYQFFTSVTPHSEVRIGGRLLIKPITRCDSSTQTDTHILESNIVKSYEWNEWELRRKAIKLANLRTKVTHSMQANLSHMRRENCSQVYLPKDVGTQTKRENSSNVPKPQIFLAGLRGNIPKATHMVKVNLTRAVDET